MADFVCRCGTYIRAYAPPGSKVVCTQCGAVLTNGRADEYDDQSRSSSNHSSDRSRSNANSRPLFIAGSVLSAALLCAAGWWLWSQKSQPPVKQPIQKRAETPETAPPKIAKPEPAKQANWSNLQGWVPVTEQTTQVSAMSALAQEIIDHGTLEFSSGFWDRLVAQSYNAQGETALKKTDLQAFLNQPGLKPLTSQDGITCDHWSILAFHSNQNTSHFLIRYFREPVDSDPNQSSQWISSCQSMLTLDEFQAATQAVFQDSPPPPPSTQPPPTTDSPDDTPSNLYFTPSFGYVILVFQSEADEILWKDLIPLPGETPLSRAANPDSAPASTIIDIFGEYQADMDKPLSGSLYSNEGSDPSNLPAQTRRIIASIPETRARRLAEIVEAATIDTNNLDARVARFRKEFPNDIGADALLISVWCSRYNAKRATAPYDDSGRIYIDAAHRLFMRTSDPLLLEIKSRIYQSYGRRLDSEKSQTQAEQAGHKSFTLLEQRITEAAESKDKEKLLDYVGKLNAFVQSLPKSAISPRIQSQWNKQLTDWKSQTKTQ